MNEAPRNISEARDRLEEAIILALHASKRREEKFIQRDTMARHGERAALEGFGLEVYCPKKPEYPRKMFSVSYDHDRIYTSDLDYLVVSPELAIADRLETCMLCNDGSLKWTCIVPMPRPRGITALTNRPVKWYAMHYREISKDTRDIYQRRPLALADGRVCKLHPLGVAKWSEVNEIQRETSVQLAIVLSVFEDAIRAGSMLATVQEHVALSFPIGEDGYKSFLRVRDGYRNTPTERLNPILHWCREHIRRVDDRPISVRGHDKGAEEIVVGPMRLSISRSTGYEPFMRPAQHSR